MLRPAGIYSAVTESLPTAYADSAVRLAHIFKTSVEEIEARMHPVVAAYGHPKSFISFFGTPIRSLYRETQYRRVSPTSLNLSDHHRALWDLRVFSFCPESKETLISACPNCGAKLGWRWTLGVTHCEACGEDLRDFPQPKIECADMEALDFVTGLVNLDPKSRGDSLAMVKAPLDDLDAGELFDFCIAFGRRLAIPVATAENRFRPISGFSSLTPDVLALAARSAMDWQNSVDQIADRALASTSPRQGYVAVKQALGLLIEVSNDRYLATRLKGRIRESISAKIDNRASRKSELLADLKAETGIDAELIIAGDALTEFHFANRMLKRWRDEGLIWFYSDVGQHNFTTTILHRRDELAAIAAARDDAMPSRPASHRLGIGGSGADAIAQAGLIEKIARPAIDMFQGQQYRRSTVEKLIENMRAKAASSSANDRIVSLSHAARPATVGAIPWVGIFRAILAGDLKICQLPEPASLPFTRTVGVSGASDLMPYMKAAGDRGPFTRSDKTNTHEAAAFLFTTEQGIAEFIKLGILLANGGFRWKLNRADVEAFRTKFMLSNEIANRCLWHPVQVRPFLAKKGIEPVYKAIARKILVWDRAQVEKALRLE
jgi:hypothetical protein